MKLNTMIFFLALFTVPSVLYSMQQCTQEKRTNKKNKNSNVWPSSPEAIKLLDTKGKITYQQEGKVASYNKRNGAYTCTRPISLGGRIIRVVMQGPRAKKEFKQLKKNYQEL